MTKTPIEERKIYAALAVAVAACLELEGCPPAPAGILVETVNPLEDLLGAGTGYSTTAALLRALAESGDGFIRSGTRR